MSDASPCVLHPQEPVLGACQRCGDFVCRFCLRGKRLVCAKCSPLGEGTKPDLNVALRYAFSDPDWLKKIAIGGACFLAGAIFFLPIFLLMGYQIRVAKREQHEPQTLLPEWDDLGGLFVSGFKFWVSQLIPVFLMLTVLFLVIGGVIAVGVAAGVAGSSGSGSGGANVAGVFAALGMFGAILLIIPISLGLSLLMPAMHVHYVRTGRIGAGLEFREIWRIATSRFGDYLLLFVYHFLIQIIGTFVGELACGVGLLATLPWMMIIQGYLVGRYAGWLDAEEGPVA